METWPFLAAHSSSGAAERSCPEHGTSRLTMGLVQEGRGWQCPVQPGTGVRPTQGAGWEAI